MMINFQYNVIKEIGRGRSTVYLCNDTVLNKNVVLKILPEDVGSYEIDLLNNEYQILEQIDNPNVVKCYNKGVVQYLTDNETDNFNISKNCRFIVIEYFEGFNLASHPYELTFDDLDIIATKILSFLYYLHQSNFLYLDLKLENILISKENDNIEVKIIDFGLCRENQFTGFEFLGGTTEYISPEMIKGEIYDHRADLYSFGILMYRLFFNKFPFSYKEKMEVYRAHIDEEVVIPISKVSIQWKQALKKLLEKSPNERYYTALQIIYDLFPKALKTEKYFWRPIHRFCGREEVISPLLKYVVNSKNEIITIRGEKGSGKTAILKELHKQKRNSILLETGEHTSGFRLLKHFLRIILFNTRFTTELPSEFLKEVFSNDENTSEIALKNLIKTTLEKNEVLLLIDDYNQFDEISREYLNEIILLAKISGSKIILTENSDTDLVSDVLPSVRVYNIRMLSEETREYYVRDQFAPFFPQKDLLRILKKYTTLNPGNISNFYSSIISESILRFDTGEPIIINNELRLFEISRKSSQTLYRLVQKADDETRYLLQLLSAFTIELSVKQLEALTALDESEIDPILQNLRDKGIIDYSGTNRFIAFTNTGIKDLIYNDITDQESFHRLIISGILRNKDKFSLLETARQYNFVEDTQSALSYYLQEFEKAEKHNAYNYQKKILEEVLTLPLDEHDVANIEIKNCELLYKKSNFKETLNKAVYLINKFKLTENLLLQKLKANSLIKVGKTSQGIDLLYSILDKTTEESSRYEITLDIANAVFDLDNFDEAEKLCNSLLEDKSPSKFLEGGVYNLLALISFFAKQNINETLTYFKKSLNAYEAEGHTSKAAGLEVNIGNIYNIQGDQEKALYHWESARRVNAAVGNYEQEAKIFLSYGIYHLNRADYEKSTDSYTKALKIFETLGDKYGQGLAYINMSEVYLLICEFDKAKGTIKNAGGIFETLRNSEDLYETLFLKCKYSLQTGDFERASTTLQVLGNQINRDEKNERLVNLHFYFTQLLKAYNGDDKNIDLPGLENTAKFFIENDEKYNYGEIVSLIIRSYRKARDINSAKRILDEAKKNLTGINKIFTALLLTLEAKVMLAENDSGSALNFLEESYDKLEETSITHLTLDTTYLLSYVYNERGNYSKAFSLSRTAGYLVKYFSNKLTDGKEQKLYYSRPDIKEIISFVQDL